MGEYLSIEFHRMHLGNGKLNLPNPYRRVITVEHSNVVVDNEPEKVSLQIRCLTDEFKGPDHLWRNDDGSSLRGITDKIISWGYVPDYNYLDSSPIREIYYIPNLDDGKGKCKICGQQIIVKIHRGCEETQIITKRCPNGCYNVFMRFYQSTCWEDSEK